MTAGYSGPKTTLKISSGVCFTVFVVVLTALLILSMIVVARWITIEKNIKNQFRAPNQDHKSLSPDRGHVPKFAKSDELYRDISQMYHYHDCCYREDFCQLPGELLARISYSRNKSKESPNVVIFKKDDIVYCIFRSTKTKMEMKKDIDFSQVLGVHSGFRDIFNDVHPNVLRVINKHAEEGDKIILFGHSLGGALVDLTSKMIMTSYPSLWKRTLAFSSGAPRVFTPERSDEFSSDKMINNYYKIINDADVVNQLPSTVSSSEGLFRAGKKYFYKSFNNYSRIIRFNYVPETQLMDSHISLTYSENIWKMSDQKLPRNTLADKCE